MITQSIHPLFLQHQLSVPVDPLLRMALSDVSEQVLTRDVLRQELKALLEEVSASSATPSGAAATPDALAR